MTPIPHRIDPELLARVLAGDGDETDRARVGAFLQAHPEFSVLWDAAQASDATISAQTITQGRALLARHLGTEVESLPFWSDELVETPVETQTLDTRLHPRPQQHRSVASSWHRVAAIAAACATLVIGVIVGTRTSHPTATSTSRVYRTAAAQQATVTLRDGTRITLAPLTTLTIDTESGTERVVSLNGHAFFDVVSAQGTSFTVRVGNTVARVLGTAFDVQHYMSDPDVRIIVTSGKVMTSVEGRPPVILTAGMGARVGDSTVTMTNSQDIGTYTQWVDGQLIFRQTPVPDLLRSVGQWYGVEFRYSDSSIASGHMTLTLDHKTLTEALTMLESLLDVTMTFDKTKAGVVATLHPRRDATPRLRHDDQSFSSSGKEVGR